MIEIEQLRLPGKKRKRRWHKDFKVADVRLETIQRSLELRTPADLLSLLNIPPTVENFNTADLATIIDRPRWHAQQIAYVLRKTGAIDSQGRDRSGIIYQRAA